MQEKLVKILNEMAEYLSIAQMKKLQEVLLENLDESHEEKTEISNTEYLQLYLDANPALFVTLDSPYDRLKISGVEIRIRELGRRLHLTKIHPHKFRRTMATRAIDKGMPIEQVQKILGHSQIDTTMQYAIVNQGNVKASHQRYIA
mgnify:CR=1 FL=1